MLAAIRDERPDLSLMGGDAVVEGLEVASGRLPGVPLLQLDARRLPFDSEFDVVAALDVLEHIEEDELVLREIGHSATSTCTPPHTYLAGHRAGQRP